MNPKKRPLNFLKIAGLFCLWLSVSLTGFAESSVISTPTREIQYQKSRLVVEPGYVSLSVNGRSQTGISTQITFLHGLNDVIAIGGGVQQVVTLSGFRNLYTSLFAEGWYSVLGSVRFREEVTSLMGVPIVKGQDYFSGALRVGVNLRQAFFSGTTDTVTFSGFGGSIVYEFPSQTQTLFSLGAGLDFLGGGSTTVTPMRFFIGIGFWL